MSRKKVRKPKYQIFYTLFILLVLAVGSVLAFTQSQQSQDSNSRAATTNCTVTASQLTTKSQEKELFDKVNTYRSQKGLAKLSWNPVLKQAAAWQSLDMLAHNSYSHIDSLGRSTAVRVVNCGYSSSNTFGENLTIQNATADSALNYWKGDPSHNQYLLSTIFTNAAVAVAIDSSGKKGYWTMVFGVGSTATPTFGCIGTNNCVPTSVPTKVPTPTTKAPTTAPTVAPTSGSANPTNEPTEAVPTTATDITPTPGTGSGNQGDFITLLIQFLVLFFQLLLEWFKL